MIILSCFLGNDNIYGLTNQKLYSVRFDLKDVQQSKAYALYDKFWTDDEDHKYTLHISDYSGDAGMVQKIAILLVFSYNKLKDERGLLVLVFLFYFIITFCMRDLFYPLNKKLKKIEELDTECSYFFHVFVFVLKQKRSVLNIKEKIAPNPSFPAYIMSFNFFSFKFYLI